MTKKEMAMLSNGNYEEIISYIQHECFLAHGLHCVERSTHLKELRLIVTEGDPYEDGFQREYDINYCPACGYKPS